MVTESFTDDNVTTMMKKLSAMHLLLVLALPATAQCAPTMGWSSWNTFALDINKQLIRQQADAMHNSGLQDVGDSLKLN